MKNPGCCREMAVRRDSTVQFKGLTAHVSVLAEVRKTDKMFSVW